ncbi:AmmeMemoRadiSam system protein B [Desulfomonile tiedjei]|uniref:Putative dioxygenase n=1 Tax=Desulfomonile tiedjei (strain ATCC 49306 / DSM 6799 / DCB-1) TaxID=706587 RepID=I4CF73_DESTA|nr:AmmeMemoRadiSam system protein B [Desulfomonile tiedjei]AFM28214.1 putative dioxygenase [Desulfomonile tiedjei DSM 6799]
MSTRKRALPSGWYPESAEQCRREIEEFLTGFKAPAGSWKGGIAPHAGWYFSGKAAAKVMKTLAESAHPDRIVLFGGHLPSGSPIIYADDEWETPFGMQPLDSHLAKTAVSSGNAVFAGRNFADNTVEIQLPMIRMFFPHIPVIAVHSPATKQAAILAESIHNLLNEKGLSAIYIGSADLTHYGPNYGFSPKGTGASAVTWVREENDRSLIDKALTGDVQGVIDDAFQKHNTCSAGPIASVMASVGFHGIHSGTLLDYYTSHDIMPGTSFVGYSAIVF